MHLQANFTIYATNLNEIAALVARLNGLKFDEQPPYANALVDPAGPTVLGGPIEGPLPDGSGFFVADIDEEQHSVAAAQDAQPGEPKRTRRTKAQIEADNAAAANPPEPKTEPYVFGDTAKPEPSAPIEGGEITADTLKAVLSQLLAHFKATGRGAIDAKAVLETATGVGNLTAMPQEKYGAALAAMLTALGS